MKNIFYFLVFLFFSCSTKKEDETACLPLPNNKDINIVDKITRINVFTSGRFTQNQLQIATNPANVFPVNFSQNGGLDIFTIVPIKTEGIINFSIILNDEITIPMQAKIIINNGCGTNYYFENFISVDTNYVVEENGTSLKIKI